MRSTLLQSLIVGMIAAYMPVHAASSDDAARAAPHQVQPSADVVTDFALLPDVPPKLFFAGVDETRFILYNPAHTARVVSSGKEKVLTGAPGDNQAELAILFPTRRTHADIAVGAYSGQKDATIRFHQGSDFAPVDRCTVVVHAATPARAYTCTADRGQTIQAVSWMGGDLMVEHVALRNVRGARGR